MTSRLMTGHVRITLSFEGAADDVSMRLIEFLKTLPADERAAAMRAMERGIRERRKKALRVVRP
jgi:hypothetical protein